MSSISFLYWNACGLRGKLPELDSFLSPPPPPPRLPTSDSNRFSGLHTLDGANCEEEVKIEPFKPPDIFPQSSHSGGLAFLVRRSLAYQLRLDLSYNIPGATRMVAPRADPAQAASPARNSAVAWLEARLPNQPSCLFGLVYLHPAADTDDWGQLAAALSSACDTGLPTFILGDFNSHSDEWGDPREGDSHFAAPLLDLCSEIGLAVLNSSHAFAQITRPERRAGHSGEGSIIDLGLASHPDWISQFQILCGSGLHSDHFPLLLSLDFSSSLLPPLPPDPDSSDCARPAWDTRGAIWSEYRSLVERFLAEPSCVAALEALRGCAACHGTGQHDCSCDRPTVEQRLEMAWLQWKGAVLDAAHLALKVKCQSSYSKSWWNYPGGDLPAAYRVFRAASRLQEKFPNSLDVRRKLAEARKQWRDMQRRAKEWCHTEMCDSIQADPQAVLNWRAWNRTRQESAAASSSLRSIPNPADNSLPSSISESLDNLAVHFRSITQLDPLDLPHRALQSNGALEVSEWGVDGARMEESKELVGGMEAAQAARHRAIEQWVEEQSHSIIQTACPLPLHSLFSFQQLSDHLSAAKDSAPGCDHTPVSFLRHGGAALQHSLLLLFNFSWTHGALPLDWRSAHVVALYKGKGDATQPTNYRPISLTSCVVRSMEHLIHKRLYAFAEDRGLLHNKQFGFRKQRSTLDAVYTLTERIKFLLSHKHGRAVPVAFLDLAKAYDRTWHPGLLQRLAKIGIRGRAWAWIRAFLKQRRFRIVQGDKCSGWKEVAASVPQGAVLSPLLFALFLDPIASLFDGPEFQLPFAHDSSPSPQLHSCIDLQLFADDIALSPDTRLAGWQAAFRLALQRLAEFAAEWRLTFSLDASKSAIVYFTRPQSRILLDTLRFPTDFLLCVLPLRIVESYVYLGVTLHFQLSWEPHFQRLLRKARAATGMVLRALPRIAHMGGPCSNRRAAGAQAPVRGPHFSAVRSLVLGCLYPCCTYGLQFLSGAGTTKRLERLQSVLLHG